MNNQQINSLLYFLTKNSITFISFSRFFSEKRLQSLNYYLLTNIIGLISELSLSLENTRMHSLYITLNNGTGPIKIGLHINSKYFKKINLIIHFTLLISGITETLKSLLTYFSLCASVSNIQL